MVALRVTTRLDGRPDLRVRWEPPYGKYRRRGSGVLSFADIAVGVIHLPSQGTPTLLGSTFSEVAVKGERPDPLESSSRRLSRRTTTSTTSIPPLGDASACSSRAG